MNILAVEPFYSGSHKAFLEGLKKHSQHHVIPVNLSYKGRKWRMHGNSVALAGMTQEVEEDIDLLLVSSMTNLPAFLSLTSPRFSHAPKVMYMHENQFTQPMPEGEERDQTYCYLSYLSMLSADRLIFSSRFHKRDFLKALQEFLDNYPDDKHFYPVDKIADKSMVLYPGLDLERFDAQPDLRQSNENPVIVWNQRWQFDRNPAMFFRVLNRLNDIDLTFDLILAGDTQHEKPEEFEKAWQRYGRRITHFGYVENKENYSKLLHSGDIVVSTATYEFFCVAIMEAIYCGCHPLVPNRLHYPELVPKSLQKPLLHAPVLYDTEDELFHYLKDLLTHQTDPLPKESLQTINKHLEWSNRIEEYDAMFEESLDMHITPALS
jgi:glycosyltransferase involved in cell wall biosynthesis